MRVRVTAKNTDGSATVDSAETAVIRTATAPPPTTVNGCPAGTGTLDVAAIAPPARLLIDGQTVSPTVITRSSSDVTLRFHVSACSGRSISDALVYATAVPFSQFSIPAGGADRLRRMGDADDAPGPVLPGFVAAAAAGRVRAGPEVGRVAARRRLHPPARLVPGAPASSRARRPRAPPTIGRCARSSSTRTGCPSSPSCPSRPVPGLLVRVRACGLCGSDVEKLGRAAAGTVLGHEIAGELEDGTRVTVMHRVPCGDVRALSRRPRVDLRRVRASCGSRPAGSPSGCARRTASRCRTSLAEHDGDLGRAARVRAARRRARAARPRARRRLRRDRPAVGAGAPRRGDEVVAADPRAERRRARARRSARWPTTSRSTPPSSPRAAGVERRAPPARAGRHAARLLGARATTVPVSLDAVYRKELHVVGSRSATPGVLRRRDRAAAGARRCPR